MENILIVEDSPTQAAKLQIILDMEGYHSTIASNGEKALACLHNGFHADAVLCDVEMPGISGYELCRLAKRDEKLKSLPFILLTGRKQPKDIIDGLQCGADGFLTKPYTPDQIVERLNKLKAFRSDEEATAAQGALRIAYSNQQLDITAGRNQILDLLLSTFEDLEKTNRELADSRAAIAAAKEQLDQSLRYASRIQNSIFPPVHALHEKVKEHFLLYEPKDVVGGDVYWCDADERGSVIAVADCTGHGVPGALMTMITSMALSNTIRHVPDQAPDQWMSEVNRAVKTALNQNDAQGENESDDGLEMAICQILGNPTRIRFSGAGLGLFIAEQGQVREVRADRTALGYRHVPADQAYSIKDLACNDAQTFYLCTDGIIEQVGGKRRIGFGKRRLAALLESIHEMPMNEQQVHVARALREYRGAEEQRDDVTMIGFRVL